MVGSVPQITDKANLKREGGFVSDLRLHRGVLTCSPTTSGHPGAGRSSKPLRRQKKRDTHAHLFSFWLRRWDPDHTVLHFLCGENAAVGSAALTVPRTVIHYRLTLRVIRPSGS